MTTKVEANFQGEFNGVTGRREQPMRCPQTYDRTINGIFPEHTINRIFSCITCYITKKKCYITCYVRY